MPRSLVHSAGHARWLPGAALAAVVLTVSACADRLPTTPPPLDPAFVISDGGHSNGNSHFFFLPPLVPNPTTTGVFDGALSPTIDICEYAGSCVATVAQFTTSSGTGGATVDIDVSAKQYMVNWDTKTCIWGACALDPAKTYRLQVFVNGILIGFADVDVVSKGSELKNVQTGEYIGLLNGRTLPVKFRIEMGIVGALAVAVMPGTVHVGESATATATVVDLHGVQLSGIPVTWSTSGSPATLSTVSGTTDAAESTATIVTAGQTPGLATISATAAGLVASGALQIASADACIPSPSGTAINTPAPSMGPLYVTNQDGNRVTAYAAGATGDAVPMVTIAGSNTGLNVPRGIARDAVGNLYVANYGSNAIEVFAPGASGDATPIRAIVGGNTQLNGLEGLAIDGAGSLYVADQVNSKILVFRAGANGDVAPIRTIGGSCTGLYRPMGLGLDRSGNLYAANLGAYTPGTSSVTVYAAGSAGNVTPLSIIAGSNTGLYNPLGIALDAAGSIYVSNYGNTDNGPSNFATAVTVFAAGSSGNMTPRRTITGTMSEPTGLAVDAVGQLFVASFAGQFISIYAADAVGSVVPTGTISGGNTQINRPAYITF